MRKVQVLEDSYKLKNGDAVKLYYTDDYTLENESSAGSNGSGISSDAWDYQFTGYNS